MIIKVKKGWKIISKTTGRRLGFFKTKKEAEKRLKQIEYFKKMAQRKKRKNKK